MPGCRAVVAEHSPVVDSHLLEQGDGRGELALAVQVGGGSVAETQRFRVGMSGREQIEGGADVRGQSGPDRPAGHIGQWILGGGRRQ